MPTVPLEQALAQAREIEALRYCIRELIADRDALKYTLEAWAAECGEGGPRPIKAEVERLQQWVNDLQAGMYINCVYCGHRYGPDDKVPATMAQVLKDHIAQCPKHPMSALKADVAYWRRRAENAEARAAREGRDE